jgi:esterase/lipase superfamily enzyme
MIRGNLALVLLVWLVVACAPRADIVFAPEGAVAEVTRSVFVGTNRMLEADGVFSAERSTLTRFRRYDIGIPADREPGSLRLPRSGQTPDPTRDFLTMQAQDYPDTDGFRRALRMALAAQPPGARDAVVFVHGYNTRYAEGIYRLAQLSHDLQIPGVAVHFAWPSAGDPMVYAFDRDSALFARDGLESLLRQVAAAGPRRIILIAHSMGSQLTMETLRQIAIDGRSDLMGRIGAVVLISPDLDVDVFRAQAQRIGTLPRPFLIVASPRDRILALSGVLTGQHERLGHLGDASVLADLDVTLVDVSAFSTGTGHFNLGDSPALISLAASMENVDAAFGRDPASRPGLLPGSIITLRRATQVVLRPVAVLARRR